MAKNPINNTETVEILQTILDSIGDAVLVAFKDAHVMRLNPAAENMFGHELRMAPLSEWLNLHGFFLPDRVSPCPTEERPLVRALRGESFDDVESATTRRAGGLMKGPSKGPMVCHSQGTV
jgi:PAS domain-containing protein